MVNLDSYLTGTHPFQPERLTPRWLQRLYRKMWRCTYPGPFEWQVERHADLLASIQVNSAFDPGALSCSTGVVITSWNRPQYLRACLHSLARSALQDAVVILVDDASDDPASQRILADFDLPTPLIKLVKTRRTNMHVSLDIGWCLAQSLGCRYLCNLDADAIVRRDWLHTLRGLFESLPYDPDTVVLSGFNRSNSPCILEVHDRYLRKYRMGGINYFFTPAWFNTVRFLLFNENWDSHIQYYCGALHARRFRLLCCKPSVVQHLGEQGFNSGVNSPFDQADDFVAD